MRKQKEVPVKFVRSSLHLMEILFKSNFQTYNWCLQTAIGIRIKTRTAIAGDVQDLETEKSGLNQEAGTENRGPEVAIGKTGRGVDQG